jgi:hypothetical protein
VRGGEVPGKERIIRGGKQRTLDVDGNANPGGRWRAKGYRQTDRQTTDRGRSGIEVSARRKPEAKATTARVDQDQELDKTEQDEIEKDKTKQGETRHDTAG